MAKVTKVTEEVVKIVTPKEYTLVLNQKELDLLVMLTGSCIKGGMTPINIYNAIDPHREIGPSCNIIDLSKFSCWEKE